MTTTKRQTAGNNALLRKIKRVFNGKIYRASLGVMNTLGEEACIAYVQQYVRPPILPHLDYMIKYMDARAATKGVGR